MAAYRLKRPPVFLEDRIEIHLTKGYVAWIDLQDDHLANENWSASMARNGVYAYRHPRIALHREVLGLASDDPRVADHLDGNTLDCRQSNLRVVNRLINGRNITVSPRNTSGFNGVHWDKRSKIWRAKISGKKVGHFHTAEEANAARIKAEAAMWGIQPRRAHLHRGE